MDHVLAFRVMRMSKPPLQPSSSMLVDVDLDFLPDNEAAETLQQRKASCSQASTSDRLHLRSAADICNISGMLELPTAFGSLFLGEAFQSYVSVINTSKISVHSVHVKAELESSRAKATLYDNGAQAVVLQPGARHDFIIRHDVKDVGQHTLTCSVAYTMPDGERRVLPQNFKFTSSNPLSVRTKSRRVHNMILLEACIENTSRSPMVLDYVRFDPFPPMSAIEVGTNKAGQPTGSKTPFLKDYLQGLKIITPLGGALNLIFQLQSTATGTAVKAAASSGAKELGKLDIKWRTTLGDVGRLQTLPISAPAAAVKDISLQVAHAPQKTQVEQPFSVTLQVTNNLDRRWQDLTVSCRQDHLHEGILPLGSVSSSVAELVPNLSRELHLQFLALKSGIVMLPDIILSERGKLAPLDSLSISVEVQ